MDIITFTCKNSVFHLPCLMTNIGLAYASHKKFSDMLLHDMIHLNKRARDTKNDKEKPEESLKYASQGICHSHI